MGERVSAKRDNVLQGSRMQVHCLRNNYSLCCIIRLPRYRIPALLRVSPWRTAQYLAGTSCGNGYSLRGQPTKRKCAWPAYNTILLIEHLYLMLLLPQSMPGAHMGRDIALLLYCCIGSRCDISPVVYHVDLARLAHLERKGSVLAAAKLESKQEFTSSNPRERIPNSNQRLVCCILVLARLIVHRSQVELQVCIQY